jgi:hypothetical protein
MAKVGALMRQMLYGLTIVHRRQQEVLFTSSLICGTNTIGLTKTHHNQSRGRTTHYISLKVVVDPRNLYFTQSCGRTTHLISSSKSWQTHAPYIYSKLWQTHAHYISLKVVVDPRNLYFTQSCDRTTHLTSPSK